MRGCFCPTEFHQAVADKFLEEPKWVPKQTGTKMPFFKDHKMGPQKGYSQEFVFPRFWRSAGELFGVNYF